MNKVKNNAHRSLNRLILSLSLLSFSAAASIQNDCLQVRAVGICYWYYYFGSETTVIYGHFNPEVIVDITNPQGVNRAEDGYRTDSQNRNHNNLIFQEASAYGHPFSGQLYCPSETTAIQPFFISELDEPSWRWGGMDSLTTAAWVPGLREIGNWPKNNWGAVYPRTGWTTQHSEPKASGIVAQRVGDIITRDIEPHVYISILDDRIMYVDDDMVTWPPKELEENTNKEGWWQITELDFGSASSGDSSTSSSSSSSSSSDSSDSLFGFDLECLLFGEDDTTDMQGWGSGKVNEDGEYRYTLWRPYTCCEVGTGALVPVMMPYPSPEVTN